MQFHTYVTRLERTPQLRCLVKSKGVIDRYREWRDYVLDHPKEVRRMEDDSEMRHGRTLAEAWSELAWIETKRPYWRVYPCITEMIDKTDLDKVARSQFGLTSIFNECSIRKGRVVTTSICVDFAKSCEPHGICNIFLCWHWHYEIQQWDYFLSLDLGEGGLKTVFGGCKEGTPIAEWGYQENEIFAFALKLVAFIGLVKDDPTFVTRDVLNEDAKKYEDADEELKRRLEEKAKRRGRFGWTIGQHYESIPHLRRPHFAVRWTGKGGTIPQLRPIKAAVVHRKKLTEIPTGYRDKEEAVS